MNFPSQTIEVENKSITAFPMKSIIAIVDILKSIFQKHLAESISINTKFTKVKSPYIGESLIKFMFIQDLNTFNVSSEKVRCSTCEVYILKSRMMSHVAKHLAFDEILPHWNNCGTCGLIGYSLEISTKGRRNSKLSC
jgi:hypothetical protein